MAFVGVSEDGECQATYWRSVAAIGGRVADDKDSVNVKVVPKSLETGTVVEGGMVGGRRTVS